MKIQELKSKWDSLTIKKNLKGKDALEAVKNDGYALQYVVEQTEAICLEAVKQDRDALKYVEEQIFNHSLNGKIVSITIDNKTYSATIN